MEKKMEACGGAQRRVRSARAQSARLHASTMLGSHHIVQKWSSPPVIHACMHTRMGVKNEGCTARGWRAKARRGAFESHACGTRTCTAATRMRARSCAWVARGRCMHARVRVRVSLCVCGVFEMRELACMCARKCGGARMRACAYVCAVRVRVCARTCARACACVCGG